MNPIAPDGHVREFTTRRFLCVPSFAPSRTYDVFQYYNQWNYERGRSVALVPRSKLDGHASQSHTIHAPWAAWLRSQVLSQTRLFMFVGVFVFMGPILRRHDN